MALFTDGPCISAQDLQENDASVLAIANTEGIDVGAKVALAQQDVANDVLLFLLRRASFRDYEPNLRRARGLTDVVVADALKQWNIHKALALVYRDAYNNQLNDRYQGKWNEYDRLAKVSSRKYFELGVGVVGDPMPKAGTPVLSGGEGNGSGGTFYVAATWVNSTGQEGAPSGFAALVLTTGQVLTVALTGAPQNATGWNVYAGTSPNAATSQNSSPIAVGSSWTMSGGLTAGTAMTSGQAPAWFIVDNRKIERG